jgi:exosortase/archaeosortase family protein
VGIILYGLFLLLTREQIAIALLMILPPSYILYNIFKKKKQTSGNNLLPSKASTLNIFLGFSLIILDAGFNILFGGKLGSFDVGIISTGMLIIFLNMNLLKLRVLDETYISFISRFLFVFMLLYGFLFSGIQYITGNLTENYLLTYLTIISGKIAGFFLSFFGDTTIVQVFDSYSHGILINFKGFSVSVYSPCSGAESIVVFLSSVIGYVTSNDNIKVKKIAIYSFIGLISLFIINVIRIILLVIIGYRFGFDALSFFHYNLGWIFFVSGMAIFWWLVMREADK